MVMQKRAYYATYLWNNTFLLASYFPYKLLWTGMMIQFLSCYPVALRPDQRYKTYCKDQDTLCLFLSCLLSNKFARLSHLRFLQSPSTTVPLNFSISSARFLWIKLENNFIERRPCSWQKVKISLKIWSAEIVRRTFAQALILEAKKCSPRSKKIQLIQI